MHELPLSQPPSLPRHDRPRSPYRGVGHAPRSYAFHIVLRLLESEPFALTTHHRRVAAVSILTIGKQHGLLGFGMADNHIHVLAGLDREDAGQLARRIELSLRKRLALSQRFEPARVRPVESPRHLLNALRYVHRQPKRHLPGLDELAEGTSLPDLLGLRVIAPDLAARVKAKLPRLRPYDLLEDASAFAPAPGPLDLRHLAAASAAAFALGSLRERSTRGQAARHAAVHVGHGLGTGELASRIGLDASTARRLRLAPADPTHVAAVVAQLRLRVGPLPVAQYPDAGGLTPLVLEVPRDDWGPPSPTA